jgi:hypothetical protein
MEPSSVATTRRRRRRGAGDVEWQVVERGGGRSEVRGRAACLREDIKLCEELCGAGTHGDLHEVVGGVDPGPSLSAAVLVSGGVEQTRADAVALEHHGGLPGR